MDELTVKIARALDRGFFLMRIERGDDAKRAELAQRSAELWPIAGIVAGLNVLVGVAWIFG